jgi:hypothetical protein
MITQKKITLATFKSFVRKNADNLMVKNKSSFDGMTDCVEHNANAEFRPARPSDWSIKFPKNTLGIQGIYLVGSSRDYFSPFNEYGMKGISVYNCCGSFVVAIPA